MSANQTLLNFIAHKHTNRTENVAVDALGYILSRSASAREALTDLLQEAGIESASISRVRTEATGEGGERPDLACYDDQDNECLLIEAKFWARLTENQPNAYLDRLPRGVPSALLFVAPAARLRSLWSELQRALPKQVRLAEPNITANWISAAIRRRNHHLMVVDWATLLGAMAKRAQSAGDATTTNDIDQLRGLASREDEEAAFLPLQPEEMNPEIPRRIRSWRGVVDGVIHEMTESGWVKAVNKNPRPASDDMLECYGRLLDFAGTEAWFGVNHDHWATRRNTPLWLELYSSDALPDNEESRQRLREIASQFPGEGADEETWFVPIFVPTGEEHPAVQKHIVERLEFICRLIDPEGPMYKKG